MKAPSGCSHEGRRGETGKGQWVLAWVRHGTLETQQTSLPYEEVILAWERGRWNGWQRVGTVRKRVGGLQEPLALNLFHMTHTHMACLDFLFVSVCRSPSRRCEGGGGGSQNRSSVITGSRPCHIGGSPCHADSFPSNARLDPLPVPLSSCSLNMNNTL